MAKKTGLGRGLSNLIPGGDKSQENIQIQSNPDYKEIPITDIDPNPDQPRKRFTEEELKELATTIESVGLIEPVVVRVKGERFQLISGERRWRACQLAGYKKIPAVVKQVNDVQALEMGIIENIQREELTAIEEARAYDVWMKETGLKPSQLAERVGKDRTTITNLLRLLKLPDEVLQMIEEKKITGGQARPLIGIGDRRMVIQLAEKIVEENWSARRVEEEVGRLMEPEAVSPGRKKGSPRVDPNIKHLEDKIRNQYTTRVQLNHTGSGKGKIVLQYANLEELDRILELMGIHKNG